MKRALSLLLSLVMLLTACVGFGGESFAAEGYQCGENVTATYDAATNTLFIDGPIDSEMYNYSMIVQPDWCSLDGLEDLSQVKTIDVSVNITHIGSCAFYGFSSSAERVIIRNASCTFGDEYSLPLCATIYGYAGSTTISFAIEHSLAYKYIYDVVFYDVDGNLISKKGYPEGTDKDLIEVPEQRVETLPRNAVHREYRFRKEGSFYSGIFDVSGTGIYREYATVEACSSESSQEIPPTCSQDGYYLNVCSKCGDSYTIPSGKLRTNHNWILLSETPSSCDTQGTEIYECTVCHEQKTELKPLANHTFDSYCYEEDTKEDGHYDKCSVCGEVNYDMLSKHTFAYSVVEEPSVTQTGTGRYTCTKCGYSYDTIIAAVTCEHTNTIIINQRASSCAEAGYTGDTYCSDCDTIIAGGTVLNKEEKHDYKVIIEKSKPSCVDVGSEEVKECTVCGKVIGGGQLAKLGHDFGDNEEYCLREGCGAKNPNYKAPACLHADETQREIRNATEPSCVTSGYTGDEYCTNCGQLVRKGRDIDSYGGHLYSGYVLDNNETCQSDGTKTARCERCGATNTVRDTGSKLPHAYNRTVVAPTCQDNGYTLNTCVFCGDKYISDYVVPAGHKYVNGSCAVCGAKDYRYTSADTSLTAAAATNTAAAQKALSSKPKPKATSIKKLKKGKKSFKITWAKVSGVTGYQIQYSTSSKFKAKSAKSVTVKGAKNTSKTIKSLKGGKKYYVRVRTYKTVNGKKYYSSWSKTKSITPKK